MKQHETISLSCLRFKKNVTIYTSSKCKNLDQILESVGGEHGNYCTLHTLWGLSEGRSNLGFFMKIIFLR